MKNYDHWHLSLMTKKYNGIFISIGKHWKGIYWHFPKITIRTFLWDIDWYNTENFNKMIGDEKDNYQTAN